jgi:hypothetical protein
MRLVAGGSGAGVGCAAGASVTAVGSLANPGDAIGISQRHPGGQQILHFLCDTWIKCHVSSSLVFTVDFLVFFIPRLTGDHYVL